MSLTDGSSRRAARGPAEGAHPARVSRAQEPAAGAWAELATFLWGERDEAKARQSLRHALYQLRQAVGDAVVVDNDSAMVPDGAIEWDVAMLERDVAAGRFREASEGWQGDLLPGSEDSGDESFRDWLEGSARPSGAWPVRPSSGPPRVA